MDNYVKTERRAIGPEYGVMLCMVEDCTEGVCGWYTMCRGHWAMVPKALPGDGSLTSEGSLADAFYRHKPQWAVDGVHKMQVELAIECVNIQIAESRYTPLAMAADR